MTPVSPEAIRAALPRASATFLRLNGLAEGVVLLPVKAEQNLGGRVSALTGAALTGSNHPSPSSPDLQYRQVTRGGKRLLVVTRKGKPAKKTKRAPAPAHEKKSTGRVQRTRNAGTWSEARYWQAVRSALRRAFRFSWVPARMALRAARMACHGPRGQKWAYLCARCQKPHLRKMVQLDHVVACGSLCSAEHVAGFLARLTPERPEDYQVLCLACHKEKTGKDRKTKTSAPVNP
jgi:hypothetical protein